MRSEMEILEKIEEIQNKTTELMRSLDPLDGPIVQRNTKLEMLKLDAQEKALWYVLNKAEI